MPKTVTQTVKSQDLHVNDVVRGPNGARGTVFRVDAKVKWITAMVNFAGATRNLRLERGEDVEVEREMPTAAEEYDDLKARVLEMIKSDTARAKITRDQARAKIVKLVTEDYRIGYSEITTLAEADARWEIFVHLERHINEGADDDKLIEVARYLIDQERDALLDDRYRGSSTSQVSNALEAVKRDVASKLVGRGSFGHPHHYHPHCVLAVGLALYLRMLDKAAAKRDAETERIADRHLNG